MQKKKDASQYLESCGSQFSCKPLLFQHKLATVQTDNSVELQISSIDPAIDAFDWDMSYLAVI